MRTFRGETLTGRLDDAVFSDARFESCEFDNCRVASSTPHRRSVLRNLDLHGTGQNACSILGAQLEDIRLHGLKRLGRGMFFLWGCVFKHVVLSGRVSAIKINRVLQPTPEKDQVAWDSSCRNYYSGVDWALDLREAEFAGSISLEAIPGSLVRRDPETQVLVTRQRLMESDWKPLIYQYGTSVGVAISWFLEGSLFDDVVLVAPKHAKYFKDELEVFEILRREGIAT